MKTSDITALIITAFEREGLELFGSAPARRLREEERFYRAWLENGYHGSMEYLVRHAPMKYDPPAILPGCASILCAGLNYYQDAGSAPPGGCGTVARYARGRDYHEVFREKLLLVENRLRTLFPDENWRTFVDTAPLSERAYAREAGLGFSGRNTLLYSAQYGSWFFLGEILTTLSVPRIAGKSDGPAGCPEGCDLCIRACPTGALKRTGGTDASRCISYLTVEHRGTVREDLADRMGGRIFGCDTCQEACPLNEGATLTREPAFLEHGSGPFLSIVDILEIDSNREFRQRFAGTPFERSGRHRLVRNACIVAGNLGLTAVIPALRRLSSSPDPGTAFHASVALGKLGAGDRR